MLRYVPISRTTTIQTNGLTLLLAGEFITKGGWTLGPRQLDEFELVFFPRGSESHYEVDGARYALSDPCLTVTRPGERHSFIWDSARPTQHLFVHFRFASPILNRLASALRLVPPIIPAQRLGIAPDLLRHLLRVAHRQPVYWRERIQSTLQTALIEIIGESSVTIRPEARREDYPSQIRFALHYVESHLSDDVSVADIARRVGWTHSHFTRVFRDCVGRSPRTFILERRIEHACQLLVRDQSSIKEVAYQSGFQDEHYFSRAFARIKGVSASEYRNSQSDPRRDYLVPMDNPDSPYPLNHYFNFSSHS